ncbi:metal-dependent hydrolase [Romboutsia sp. Marseille-P6047]|nr:metal-dependent hydrolase [Romboutsia sp. Marseille-P6047]SCI25629.1 Inner membrane protein ydjM [uncultured Clostridium sp.]
MTKETHTKGGYIFALLSLPLIYNNYILKYNFYYRIILLLIYIYFSYFGSLLPDIDMRGSYISKRFPFVYKKIGKHLKHRGFTHSLLFLSVLYFLSDLLLKYTDNNIVFICLCAGIIIGSMSHICLDLLTKEGVELFYPITINFSILSIKTSSKLEKNICKFLNLVVIFLLGYRFYILI